MLPVNKFISKLARCKSHHTALLDAAALNSNCPWSLAAGAGI